jgi:hypothetical protein
MKIFLWEDKMKTNLFYIILLTIFIGSCFPQNNFLEPAVYYKEKNYTFGLLTDVNEFINKMGEPEKRKTLDGVEYDEDLFWKGLIVTIKDKSIVHITILSQEFSVRGIKIGDQLSEVKKKFEEQNYDDENYKILSFFIGETQGIGFEYNDENIVTEIIIYFGI